MVLSKSEFLGVRSFDVTFPARTKNGNSSIAVSGAGNVPKPCLADLRDLTPVCVRIHGYQSFESCADTHAYRTHVRATCSQPTQLGLLAG